MSAGELPALGPDGCFHPAAEAEIAALVRHAAATGGRLRVRGAGHSHPLAAVYAGPPADEFDRRGGARPGDLDVMLDRLRQVTWIDREAGIVEVQAGCHLSVDPYDPTGTSTVENGLFHQLDQAGFALPTTGGISHQTVAGFLSTGSAGGTLRHGIDDAILGFRIIDGTGAIHEVGRDGQPDLFAALGVSMGLLGVITSVRLRGIPRFQIRGSEAITEYEDCAIDLFGDGDGRPTIEEHFRRIDYGRLLWWPQAGLERVVLWQAARVAPEPGFVLHPYQEVGADEQVIIHVLLTIIGNLDDLTVLPRKLASVADRIDPAIERLLVARGLPRALADAIGDVVTRVAARPAGGKLDFIGRKAVEKLLRERLDELIPVIYGEFIPLDRDHGGQPQRFTDSWWNGLPMDNGVDDRLIPTWFSELWFPIARATEIVSSIRDHFVDGGLRATGSYCFELYPARRSPFWMSPACAGDVLRMDLLWFAGNAGDPIDFFAPFWERLGKLDVRFHWGKYVPVGTRGLPAGVDAASWADLLAERYPRWPDFLALRARLDPAGVFLTPYWRDLLGIKP